MFIRVLVVALVSAFHFSTADATAASAKSKAKSSLVKRYDRNGDGKLSTTERAAARPEIAQRREQRAVRHNDLLVR
jgi:hypothetical protein